MWHFEWRIAQTDASMHMTRGNTLLTFPQIMLLCTLSVVMDFCVSVLLKQLFCLHVGGRGEGGLEWDSMCTCTCILSFHCCLPVSIKYLCNTRSLFYYAATFGKCYSFKHWQ